MTVTFFSLYNKLLLSTHCCLLFTLLTHVCGSVVSDISHLTCEFWKGLVWFWFWMVPRTRWRLWTTASLLVQSLWASLWTTASNIGSESGSVLKKSTAATWESGRWSGLSSARHAPLTFCRDFWVTAGEPAQLHTVTAEPKHTAHQNHPAQKRLGPT